MKARFRYRVPNFFILAIALEEVENLCWCRTKALINSKQRSYTLTMMEKI